MWGEKTRVLGYQQTVYGGELDGVNMALTYALQRAQERPLPTSSIIIFADNQSAVTKACAPTSSAGQQQRQDNLHLLNSLLEIAPQLTVELHWVPGHVDVEGNERADEAAKAGASVEKTEEEGYRDVRGLVRIGRTRRSERGRTGAAGGRGERDGASEETLRGLSGRASGVARIGAGGVVGGAKDGGDDGDGDSRGEEAVEGRGEERRKERSKGPTSDDDADRSTGPSATTSLPRSSPLPLSISALKNTYYQQLQHRWALGWAASFKINPTTGKTRRRVDTRPPSAHTLRLHSSLPRPLSSILTQLRTGRSHLHADLYRTRCHPNDKCECGARETRQHYLLSCPLYTHQRRLLHQHFKEDATDITSLLTDPSRIHHTLAFILDTGRFPRYHSTLPPPPPPRRDRKSVV